MCKGWKNTIVGSFNKFCGKVGVKEVYNDFAYSLTSMSKIGGIRKLGNGRFFMNLNALASCVVRMVS